MMRDHKSVQSLPDEPGVYFFIGAMREVLYVGKATSLRDRVRSYFGSELVSTRGEHMVRMVEEARRVEYRTTDSVLEALILEAKLIKDFKPRFNTREKDDKSWYHVIITTHERWPRVLLVRGKDMERDMRAYGIPPHLALPTYGPFPHAGQLKDALKLMRAIFPFFDTTKPVESLRAKNDRKLRFNTSIGVYPGAHVTEKEYARSIRHLCLFFDGKKSQLVRSLERAMYASARDHAFEQAGEYKRQLTALQHINDVSLIRKYDAGRMGEPKPVRVEGYDVAHLGGTGMVGVMTVVVGGEAQKAEYRTFTVKTIATANDTVALQEILSRRLAHTEWEYPRLIVVDGGTAQMNVARRVLAEAGLDIPLVAVTKDARHRPNVIRGPLKWRNAYASDILLANAEAHRFSLARHRKKRGVQYRYGGARTTVTPSE